MEENDEFKMAEEFEKKSLFWEASQKYQGALLGFNKLKGYENKKSLCKRKIREMNIQKAKSFLNTSLNLSLSEKQKSEMEEIINTEDINELLDKIGKSSIFCPSFQKIKKESENIPIFLSITNFDMQDKEGNFVKNGHNSNEVWFHQNYSIAQLPITYLCLSKIFHEIMDEKLNAKNLSDYFASKEIFSEDFLKIFSIAAERFFNGDYVSTLHILVPKFEKSFLNLTQETENDTDTIAATMQEGESDKIWTREKILGDDFLRNENVKNFWGEDFCEQIIFVFFSQLGLKLRHKIAHGYSKLEELNFQNSSLVIYLFLVLCAKTEKVKFTKKKYFLIRIVAYLARSQFVFGL